MRGMRGHLTKKSYTEKSRQNGEEGNVNEILLSRTDSHELLD